MQISPSGVRGQYQTFFSGAQRQNEEQWPQTETQEVLPQHVEELSIEQNTGPAAQGGHGDSLSGIIQTLDVFLCHLLKVTISRGLDWVIFRGASQPQLFCGSVIL